jgi:ribose transport system permease protein
MSRVDPQLRLSLALLATLAAVNLVANPARFAPEQLLTSLGLAAPVILVAMAATPSILSGSGGIDVSIGPMVGLLNVVIVRYGVGVLDAPPWLAVLLCVASGTALGLANGLLVVLARLQPIVATLSSYLVFAGLSVLIMPEPGGSVPRWMAALAKEFSWLPLAGVALAWSAFRWTPSHRDLLAIGGSDRAAYTAGVPVDVIRCAAYAMGGFIAGIAALAMTALIGSGDPNIGAPLTLKAIAAAALGGVSLAGGRGGLMNAGIGGLIVFLIDLTLTGVKASVFALQVALGVLLLGAVMSNAFLAQRRSA